MKVCVRRSTCDERVHLAAKADAEGRVEEGRDQREGGGHQAEAARSPSAKPAGADHREQEADELGELQRRHGLRLGRPGPSRGATKAAEDQAVGVLARAAPTRRSRSTTACRPRMTAAAALLNADDDQRGDDARRVVTHAAKRGPRTSTWSCGPVLVLVDMNVLLLLSMGWLEGSSRNGCSERGAKRRRGYSAATTTTATTRDAAQIDCAALGEHRLKAGGHARQLTQ